MHVYTFYAHLQRFAVGWGQQVSRGQKLGDSGSTGFSSVIHLHFEVRCFPSYVEFPATGSINRGGHDGCVDPAQMIHGLLLGDAAGG